ncbi:hypothetical protein SAMN04489743_2065 [Pseudarthrobacter equi]|uniref:DUF3558 domain-containing protein n=1 Tax=Pseudarthrobacter equi TaxID=728066 RepID=A0A1H1YL48_9MICC|nr:hypothetical protein [Pseudarthrobacter equi]SDT22258.1 hypothetical protein SAMN04489743_2065 [Pseudarthrobacter equi]
MKHHATPSLTLLTLTALLLSGCAATSAAAPAPAPSSSQTQSGPATGHHGGGTASAHKSVKDGPSAAALMVCGDQPKNALTSILDLDPAPDTDNTWANNTFTCTYHLNDGDLVVSVQEADDQAAALTYFNAMQALAEKATPITGLASLGFPAYETADGSAVFQKDNFILHVNASALTATLGPDNITRNALAYQLSTTILECWIKHP